MPTVLVVDDDPAFRDLAARLLRDWGHRVVGEAGTVAEALVRAAESWPEAALVDVALPDGNGFDLAVRLVSLPRPVRVVLVSADGDPAFAAAAHRAGAAGFFPKDQLTDAALRRLIATLVITNYRSQRQRSLECGSRSPRRRYRSGCTARSPQARESHGSAT